MTKAIDSGMPKITHRRVRRRKSRARIDRGDDVIVGVNKYRLDEEAEIDILDIDNAKVLEGQVARLKAIRESRDQAQVDKALAALSSAAETNQGNLLALAVEATRARATVGEISDAMEKHFGRYQAQIRSVSGVYGKAYEGDGNWAALQDDIEKFAEEEGRRPRIMVAKLGQDGHDRGAKVIATAFADIGFDVDIGPLFQTPEEAARQAIENDVHVIGISSLAAGHKTLVPAIINALADQDASEIIVIAGGVIPAQDYDFLREVGVKGIFGPGTVIPDAAREVLQAIRDARK